MSAFSRFSRRNRDDTECDVSSCVTARRTASRGTTGCSLVACTALLPFKESLSSLESSSREDETPLSTSSTVFDPYASLPAMGESDVSNDGGSGSDLDMWRTHLNEGADATLRRSLPQQRLAEVSVNLVATSAGGAAQVPRLPPFLMDNTPGEGEVRVVLPPRMDVSDSGEGRKEDTVSQLQDVDVKDKSDADCSSHFYYTEFGVTRVVDSAASDLRTVTPNEIPAPRSYSKTQSEHYYKPYPTRCSDMPPSTRRHPWVSFTEGTDFIHLCKAKKRH
ncbi:hypothetical protein STCU_10254 [Strigomonas culicis]|uniref:Uncharacterized protein n=1 Tax=Strigomonas culicis TaxID=28005 RepID=S9UTZ0_9TRYP|nr:hypothetical protein STCU_10254 [Strigomonas culicis]|eukprot:EPY18011.1 hypothetical protein STCU_10254 [Strigomonas culicis]